MANSHALIGPSSAHRWLNCPGSIGANKDKPWEQSAYALEGTTAHALLELCLRLHTQPDEFLGQRLEADYMPIDEDMVDAVGYALDFVAAYTADNPDTKVYIERPVYPGPLLGAKTSVIWGTPDIQLDNYPKELVTIDYKHGTGIPVSVKDNPQIKLYHLGMRAERGKYRRYRSVVIQPRLPKRRPVQEASLTDADLVKWADNTVRPVIPIALSDDAPRKAGDWCRYCHASGNCPAQMKETFEKAAKEFGKAPKGLTPAEIAKYMDMVPMVVEAVESLKTVAIKAVHAGVKVPGYVPAFTNARRIWRDEEQANKLLAKLGLETKERFKVELLTPKQAEDVLKAKGKVERAKRGQPRPPSPLEDVIAYTEQSPTIAKAHE